MDRLSLFLTLATGAVTTGTFVVIVMTLGYYSWPAIGGAAALGWLTAWPAAYIVSRWIKRDDPQFDHTKAEETSPLPDPKAPEV